MDTSQDDTFGSKQPKRFDWSAVRNTLRDPKSYLTAGCFFSLNVAFSSMPVFAPVIIQNMGYSAIKAQGLAAPPHLFAFVAVLVTSVISDRLQSRSIPIILHASSAMAGAVTTVIVWTVNNQQSEEGRGSNVALLNVIGQLGPLLGTRLYPESDAPSYKKGHALCAGFMGLVALLATILRLLLVRANASSRVARTSATEDGAAKPLVGSHGAATGDFEYML
ncbi:MFS general substrate transporter, partial [Aureobasidium melanogenum]